MKLPRHAEIWFLPYVGQRLRSWPSRRKSVRRAWLAITDHWEPLWRKPHVSTARRRVTMWRESWPRIAESAGRDSAGQSPRYTFFFPQEEYRAEFISPLAEMAQAGIADVEVHIHHDGEGGEVFSERIRSFCRVLHEEHGLLRQVDGQIRFGFIHGNWALDNSLPNGAWCGLNDEITLLRQLGCYADFTMPSVPSPSQSRMLNTIYWAIDDPGHPKSYDTGVPLLPGEGVLGDLLMIPGPMGLRWAERLIPRIETGEISKCDPPSKYRVRRWFELAPRIGSDVFVKLYTHGAQEENAEMLLGRGLSSLFAWVSEHAAALGCELHFVTAWQMYLAIDALRRGADPTQVLVPQSPESV